MKRTIIKSGHVVDPKQNLDKITNLLIEDGKIYSITENIPTSFLDTTDNIIDASGKIVCPGFIDIHMQKACHPLHSTWV